MTAAYLKGCPAHPPRGGGNQCSGKHRYDSAVTARLVLKHNRKDHVVLCAYRCPRCGGWHIGNKLKAADIPGREARAELVRWPT